MKLYRLKKPESKLEGFEMVSKTAKNIAFFLLLVIATSGVLAQENPWMITVFDNVSDVPEEPSHDIEFNGITIIFVGMNVFMPENGIESLNFKEDFTDENVIRNQKGFKDDLKKGRIDVGVIFKDDLKKGRIDVGAIEDYLLDENITFKKYPDYIDNEIFFKSFLNRHPFMRFELKPIEVENWTVNNITLTGKIRVHATIFKNGFSLISLILPIVTDEMNVDPKLKGDFLLADKPLKPDDVISILENEEIPTLKEGEMTLDHMFRRRYYYLERAFFENKPIKVFWGSRDHIIYSWNINKTLGDSTELVKENPWEVHGILVIDPTWNRARKHTIFSEVSNVFSEDQSLFQIFAPLGYFEHEDILSIKQIEEYGYNPNHIRLAEVVFLQDYMLNRYNDFVTVKLEELREKEESEYPKGVKEIARFRQEIIIALDELYLIEDSLHGHNHRNFVRYGKQKRNSDFMHENLRVRVEELSKISGDMNNVIMQENNMDIQKSMVILTMVGIILAVYLSVVNVYSEEIKTKLRRLREKKTKK